MRLRGSIWYGGKHSTDYAIVLPTCPSASYVHSNNQVRIMCLRVNAIRTWQMSETSGVSIRDVAVEESRSISQCILLVRGQQALSIDCLFIYLFIYRCQTIQHWRLVTIECEVVWTRWVVVWSDELSNVIWFYCINHTRHISTLHEKGFGVSLC
jgi:hypothetical protein